MYLVHLKMKCHIWNWTKLWPNQIWNICCGKKKKKKKKPLKKKNVFRSGFPICHKLWDIEFFFFSLILSLSTQVKKWVTGYQHVNIKYHFSLLIYFILSLQASLAIRLLTKFSGGAPHILCGDFNQEPHMPGYQIMQNGRLTEKDKETLRMFPVNDTCSGEKVSCLLVYIKWKKQGKPTWCGERERPTQKLQNQDVSKIQNQKTTEYSREPKQKQEKGAQVIEISVYQGRVKTAKNETKWPI